MPLRDHFHPPVTLRHSWDELHGGWPMKIVESLLPNLPPNYVAGPHVRLAGERDHTIGDEYEVRVLNTARGRQLVSVIELVSPSCKDCLVSRQAFAAKCAALLRERVSVTLVDIVTVNESNLYADLVTSLGHQDPSSSTEPTNTYAAACRMTQPPRESRLEAWYRPLALGQPLPTLPLWLTNDAAVPLDLEASYEETCRVLRIG